MNHDFWHYHLNVFPRYIGDNLYRTDGHLSSLDEQAPYTKKLKAWFEENENKMGYIHVVKTRT
jgi:histidine triad (HIT) family protein